MVKRAIFYDDCRSADRLAREYTSRSGVEPTVFFSDNKFWYRFVGLSNTFNYLTIDSFLPSSEFEIACLIKKNCQAPNSGTLAFYIFPSWRSTTEYYFLQYTDITPLTYVGLRTGAVFNYFAFPVPSVKNNDTIYNFKARFGKDVRAKVWLYGTTEPDWDFVVTRRMQPAVVLPVCSRSFGSGKIAIGGYTYQNGDWHQFSDLRITPIPTTGGP